MVLLKIYFLTRHKKEENVNHIPVVTEVRLNNNRVKLCKTTSDKKLVSLSQLVMDLCYISTKETCQVKYFRNCRPSNTSLTL